MAENTKIEWCDHSWNPWHGCVKVSAGCKFCYADAQDKRFGPSHWGPGADRKMMSDAHWQQPLRWNGEAAASGVRRKVFCASMADVFEQLSEDHLSFANQDAARFHLWKLIEATPALDWLLLTKRPENVLEMVPLKWVDIEDSVWPANVWIGTSVEDQAAADTRIPHLLKVPARVRFLSCEPLLGPVDLRDGLRIAWKCSGCRGYFAGRLQEVCPRCGKAGYWTGSHAFNPKGGQVGSGISWVIVGGESGPGARPMHPEWARGLRDQCAAAGVPFFFKQWGEWLPYSQLSHEQQNAYCDSLKCTKQVLHQDGVASADVYRVGKKEAGRLLDGRTWDEFPASQEAA